MLVILGIGVLLNYLRELSNMGINYFEREFFSDKNINNVHCEHIIYGYYCVLNCINNKAKWDYTILRNYLCNYYSWASNEGCNFWFNRKLNSSLLISELYDENNNPILFYRKEKDVYIGTAKDIQNYVVLDENILDLIQQKVTAGEAKNDINDINEVKLPENNLEKENVKQKIIHRKEALEKILGIVEASEKDKSDLIKLFENHHEKGSEKRWNDEYRLSGWAHILIDGIDNYPKNILSFLFSKKEMSEDGTYKRQFKLLEKISDGSIPSYSGINAIYILTKTAIEDAVKKYPSPSKLPFFWYVKEKQYQYLLPLSFMGGCLPDCFAVIGKVGEIWQPITLLNVAEAYMDMLIFKELNGTHLKNLFNL